MIQTLSEDDIQGSKYAGGDNAADENREVADAAGEEAADARQEFSPSDASSTISHVFWSGFGCGKEEGFQKKNADEVKMVFGRNTFWRIKIGDSNILDELASTHLLGSSRNFSKIKKMDQEEADVENNISRC